MESSGAKRKIDQESENVTPAKKSCRQSYTMDFKMRVLNDAKTSQNIRATAKSYGLDHTMVVRWKQAFEKQSKNQDQNQLKFRMSGAGRPVLDTEMEDNLFSWICFRRENQWRVTRDMIQAKAKEFSKHDTFTASEGWCTDFLRRYQLSLRQKTHQSQRLPSDLEPKVLNFLTYFRNYQHTYEIDDNYVVGMDQTACWFDAVSNKTISRL